MSYKLTLQIVFVLSCLCSAQPDSIYLQTEQFMEDMLIETDDETDNSDFYDLIEYYIRNPVNLNKASLEELSSVPYLDIAGAYLIIDHRNKYGKFFSTNELYSIPALPEGLVNKILPFLCLEESDSRTPEEGVARRISFTLRNRVIYKFQKEKGFKDNLFRGSPYKLYNRLAVRYSKNAEIGLLTEKDAGEKSYYDFYSGFLRISEWHNFRNIIIGDYLMEFGQGLALWRPFSISKGSDAVFSVKRNPGIIKPYKSALENNFFRGAAAEYNWEHMNIAAYFSKNSLDANIDSLTGNITSTPQEGFHRTDIEMFKRKSLVEVSYGACLNYYFSSFLSAGILYSRSEFNHKFKTSRINDIIADNFNIYSTYIDLYINRFNIFGEYSYDGNSVAVFSGLKISPSPDFSYIVSIRSYPENFTSKHGFGFGERSGALQNEFGICNGIKWRTSLGIVNLCYDQYKFPFATLQNPLPTDGYELMLNYLSLSLNKFTIGFMLKIKNKEITETVNLNTILVRSLKQSYRIELTYKAAKNMRLKTRMEYCRYFIKNSGLSEEGFLIFQDLRFQTSVKLTCYLRVVFFQTESFSSAIFEYENDLTGILSNVGLYGEGLRLYLVLRYNLFDWISLSFKYSETYKPAETTMGTGYQSINDNTDSRIGFQLDFIF